MEEDVPSPPTTPAPAKTRGVNGNAAAIKVKAEKMNGKARPVDEEPVANGDDEEEDGSPRGRKRARANTAGEATAPRTSQDDEEDGDAGAGKTRAGVKTLPRDPKDGCAYSPPSVSAYH
jgi:hypothetical protein